MRIAMACGLLEERGRRVLWKTPTTGQRHATIGLRFYEMRFLDMVPSSQMLNKTADRWLQVERCRTGWARGEAKLVAFRYFPKLK